MAHRAGLGQVSGKPALATHGLIWAPFGLTENRSSALKWEWPGLACWDQLLEVRFRELVCQEAHSLGTPLPVLCDLGHVALPLSLLVNHLGTRTQACWRTR